MARLFIFAACLIAFVSASVAVRADDGSAAAAYLKVRRTLRQTPLTAQAYATVTSDPRTYEGRVIELSGTITGQVASGSDRTILISIGNDVVSATLPESLRQAFWIEVGHTVRTLFSVETPLRLIAAGPEYDVAVAEQREAQENARTASTSRSLSYTRDGTGHETVAGVGAPDSYSAPSVYGDDGGHPSPYLNIRARNIFGPYHAAVRRFNHRLDAEDVDIITNSILYFSYQNDIDPRLLVAMIIAESDFNIFSTSRTGAMGLGQLMPSTAAGLGVTDPYDPEQNIAAAAHILRGHLDKFGGAPPAAGIIPESQIKIIMAAYNAGPGAVHKYHGVPPYRETQRYVKRVAALYKEMCND